MILSDPSEAVESENILPLLKDLFYTVELKFLGGNILHLLLKNISHHFMNNEESNKVLDYLVREDKKFLLNNKSDFIFGVFGK